MDYSYLFFISSGLFLGWSLGANDAANVFGTAVGTKMVRFKTAATIAIIESTTAAFAEVIKQKSSKNFLPITV